MPRPEISFGRNPEEERRVREIYVKEGMPEVHERARMSEAVAAKFLKEAFPDLFADVEVGSDKDDRHGIDLIFTLTDGSKMVADWTIASHPEVLSEKAAWRLKSPTAHVLYDERGKAFYQGEMPHLLLSGLNGFPTEKWDEINRRFWEKDARKQATKCVPNPEEFKGFLLGQIIGGLRHIAWIYALPKQAETHSLFKKYLKVFENYAAKEKASEA
jgi:hypothetical protein